MTYKFGLIGYPLSHSISAVIQKAGLESAGLEGTYDILETHPEDLADRIKFLKVNNYNGFNVTIPHKVPAALYLNEITDSADTAGCVNTVSINENKSLIGYNTDIYGFKNAIPKDIVIEGRTAAILGTGGAARAAIAGLSELGIKNINLFTRNIINSSNVLEYVRKKFENINFNAYQIQNIRDLSDNSIIINATPIGMKSFMADQMPLERKDLDNLPHETVIYDIVYNPIKTVLIKEAQKRNLRTIEGLDMLIYQAQKSIEIWTGKTADFKTMKIAALESLT